MTLEPLGNRLLVKVVQAQDRTKSGIYVPQTAQEKPQQGEVLALGERVGDDLPMVKPGDRILFAKYTGAEIKIDGDDLLLLETNDVLALVRN
ncbi:MAG TPA: co-chaperone GroES [Anaerolineae bacterium]